MATTKAYQDNDSPQQSTNETASEDTDSVAPQEESFGWSDDEFRHFLADELQKNPLSREYPDIFEAAPICMTKWRQRYRGEPKIWKRLFQTEKVLKEFIEAVPIIDAVQRLVRDTDLTTVQPEKYTIVDLACGRGYLSMFLSELLPPEKVERFVLVDKAWPMHGVTPEKHHISWTHIYGSAKECEDSRLPCYHDTWPIPLYTSKQDLKHANQRRNMKEQFFSRGPVILLAVHLCGTLSLKAVEFFNHCQPIQFFCLKPCCLPGMVHAKRHEVFTLGSHCFDAKKVCMAGKWKRNVWKGPPRSQLKDYFDRWCQNLYQGIVDQDSNCDETRPQVTRACKMQKQVMVQTSGGYQNEFLFAERAPETLSVWERLRQPTETSPTENIANDSKQEHGEKEHDKGESQT